MNNKSDKPRLAGLSLAAIGVVYGDIGTSPLYTLNTIFAGFVALSVGPKEIG